jgi:Phage gp6-like head-tail connector protein
MTATVYYDNVNQLAFLTAIFLNATGSNADPSAVSCVITDPSGAAVTHTYLGTAPADITKPLVGSYALSVSCSPSIAGNDGLWTYEWVGTGTTVVNNVQPGTFRVFTPPSPNIYCGLEELKDRLGITDNTDNYAAEQAIQAASSWINEYCGQHFYRITETRTFVPHNLLMVNIDPLISNTALNVDTSGNGTFDQAWVLGTDYQLFEGTDNYNLNALGVQRPFKKVQVTQSGKWFPFLYPYSHYDRVQIIGTWGWPSVPPTVSQACLTLSAQWFKEKDAPFGVAGVNDFGVVRIQQNPWVVEMLRPYINVKHKVGVLCVFSPPRRCRAVR